MLFLTDLHSHSTEPLRTCLNKRSDKFMEGYENLFITYAEPHVFSETFCQWRINYESKTTSLGSKTFLLLSIKGVYAGHRIDADLKILLWIGYKKNSFTWLQIIQKQEVNSRAFSVLNFPKQTEKLWKSESHIWDNIHRDNTHVE